MQYVLILYSDIMVPFNIIEQKTCKLHLFADN